MMRSIGCKRDERKKRKKKKVIGWGKEASYLDLENVLPSGRSSKQSSTHRRGSVSADFDPQHISREVRVGRRQHSDSITTTAATRITIAILSWSVHQKEDYEKGEEYGLELKAKYAFAFRCTLFPFVFIRSSYSAGVWKTMEHG